MNYLPDEWADSNLGQNFKDILVAAISPNSKYIFTASRYRHGEIWSFIDAQLTFITTFNPQHNETVFIAFINRIKNNTVNPKPITDDEQKKCEKFLTEFFLKENCQFSWTSDVVISW